MHIGVPKEIKVHEYRVGLTPAAVAELSALGHQLWVETQAGIGCGFSDADYQAAGAQIATDAEQLFAKAQLLIKVKEPQASERARLGPQHCLFTYLHLAPDLPQTLELLASGATLALNNATLPFVIALAEKGPRRALEEDPSLANGLSVAKGLLTCQAVASAHGLDYQPSRHVLPLL